MSIKKNKMLQFKKNRKFDNTKIILHLDVQIIFLLIVANMLVWNYSERKDYYSKNLPILNTSSCSAVIETYFEILKSSEHHKLWRYSNYKSPTFYDCPEVRSADPPTSVYY